MLLVPMRRWRRQQVHHRDDRQFQSYPEDREKETKRSISEIPDPQRQNVVLQWVNHLKALQVQAIKTANKYYEVVKIRTKEAQSGKTRQFIQSEIGLSYLGMVGNRTSFRVT